MKNVVSIIIPTLNEEKYIKNCLDTIIDNTYPKDMMEVFIVDGGSTDSTVSIVKEFQKKYPFIKLLFNPHKIVPYAMNIGIKTAIGKYIIRLDAHSKYPNDYIERLIEWKEKLNADNVGAICKTDVLNKNSKSLAISKVLSNKFGVGNSTFRIGTDVPLQVDTVPFGCYDRQLLLEIGMYNEKLIRNQDIELNKRIINKGGKIYLIPFTYATYYARENYKKLAENNYKNGLWNILTVYYTKDFNSLSLRHFVPLFFILSLIFPMIISLWIGEAVYLSIFSFIAYNILVIGQSLKIRNKQIKLFHIIAAFYTLHFSYGFGSLVGLFKLIKIKLMGE